MITRRLYVVPAGLSSLGPRNPSVMPPAIVTYFMGGKYGIYRANSQHRKNTTGM